MTISNDNPLLDEVRTLCLSFPGTSERVSHGAPSFFVNGKNSFVQYRNNHHGDGKIALWCAAPPGVQTMLVETEPDIYYVPAYVGHLGWVGVRLDRQAKWEDISHAISNAYLTRAPKKLREQITKQPID
ncbi:MmcQ/YjbR family DNA-binding protein [Paenibacillus sp. GCM10027626]|uniref:MmcQ/YjbR family DNA-binding protein n=1 Tax=Paenibacillus sp. GCM10027626 TaxID=3273411 RepID=UPI003639D9DE